MLSVNCISNISGSLRERSGVFPIANKGSGHVC